MMDDEDMKYFWEYRYRVWVSIKGKVIFNDLAKDRHDARDKSRFYREQFDAETRIEYVKAKR